MSGIRAISFDYGDVIELHDGEGPLKKTARLLGIPHDQIRKVYFEHNHLANVQNYNWYDMFHTVLSTLGVSKEKEEEVFRVLKERRSKSRINTDLVALFPKLRKLGLKIGILSNSVMGLRERLNENGLLALVDTAVISGEIGFQKPHKEAFQVLFEKLDLQANEVIFVDDSERSLEKATEIGYYPILYKNNEQLISDLKGAGIALP